MMEGDGRPLLLEVKAQIRVRDENACGQSIHDQFSQLHRLGSGHEAYARSIACSV
jgi:hypothetical protein